MGKKAMKAIVTYDFLMKVTELVSELDNDTLTDRQGQLKNEIWDFLVEKADKIEAREDFQAKLKTR